MKTVVTGAAGFVASHLIGRLVEGGHTVVATARRPARPDWMPPEAELVAADLAADDGLERICDGAAVVFHLAGATSSTASQEEMEVSNVTATARMCAAALEAGVGRFVHMSSTSIYGEEQPLPQPVREDVEPSPSRGYGKAKWGAEQALWEHAAKGLPAVSIRPTSMYGPRAVKLLASAILDVAIEKHGGAGVIEVPARRVEQRLVHVDDVVEACLHLAAAPGVEGRAFNLTSPHYPDNHEVARVLAGEFGMRAELVEEEEPGPSFEERSAIRERMVEAGMTTDILFTKERFRFMRKENRNNRLSLDALMATGFKFAREDFAEGAAATVEWYRSNRWII